MSRFERLIPPGNLGRVRLGAVVFGLLCLAGQFTQVGAATDSRLWNFGARAAIVLLGSGFVTTYVRGKTWGLEPYVMSALVFAAGSALTDALACVGLVLAVLTVQSLYGSLRVWAIRSVLCMLAIPAVVAASASDLDHDLRANPTALLPVFPQVLLVTALTRAIYAALRHQERTAARDALVAEAGARMLAATTIPAIHEIGSSTADALVEQSPGVVMVLLTPTDDGLIVAHSAGLPTQLAGRRFPASVAMYPAPALAASAPEIGQWQVEPLPMGRLMVLGHVRELPADVADAFRMLGNQIMLAETNRQSHDELDRQANHDHLTQLPNRAKFFRSLADAVDHREPGTVALLNIDLDDFKRVNDTFGHAAGDELLVQVAERIAEVAGAEGLGGRFGGDEFALLLTGLATPAEAEQAAELLCARLAKPLRLTAATVTVGASIGVAITEAGVKASELTRRADIAMYSAKARGKNRVEVFRPEEHGQVARHRMLEDQLPYAIERGEIVVRFQPYQDLADGTWTGVEALAQWQHPVLGGVNCRELLELAERTGLLAEVTSYILQTVCSDISGLPGGADLQVGMNVGAHQLLDPRFTDSVLATLTGCALPAGRFTLEIVESEHVDDPVARDQLHRLTAGGVRIALDDFGTGYVSLASLRAFPIHQIKIDGSFLYGDPGSLDLVLSVAQLLGTHTVVLGVSDQAQLDRLQHTGARAAQGDLLAPIMSITQLAQLLAEGAPV